MHRLTVIFSGDVQGVGFRKATQKQALSLNIKGTVQNLKDGSVKAKLEGDNSSLFTLLQLLADSFSLSEVNVTFENSSQTFTGFSIL